MKYLGVLCFTLLCGCQSIVNPSLSVYHSDLHATADGIDTSSETILNAKQNGSYASEDSVSVTFAMEGLRVKVDPLSDDQLNSLFPEDSEKGQFSTNPYTYGNWVDPLKGYCPKRFTVFRVTVTNDIYAKSFLDPMKAHLLTDQGDKLYARLVYLPLHRMKALSNIIVLYEDKAEMSFIVTTYVWATCAVQPI